METGTNCWLLRIAVTSAIKDTGTSLVSCRVRCFRRMASKFPYTTHVGRVWSVKYPTATILAQELLQGLIFYIHSINTQCISASDKVCASIRPKLCNFAPNRYKSSKGVDKGRRRHIFYHLIMGCSGREACEHYSPPLAICTSSTRLPGHYLPVSKHVNTHIGKWWRLFHSDRWQVCLFSVVLLVHATCGM